jgi:N-acetylglucosamine-6-sulfatase
VELQGAIAVHAVESRLLVALVMSVMLTTVIADRADSHPRQRDMLFILLDDTRSDGFANMDTLASDGIRFTEAYATNPQCGPARATLLTGHLRALEVNGTLAFDESDTVATRLQAAGYRTAMFGKYMNGYTGTYLPPGWDRWLAIGEEALYFGGTFFDENLETVTLPKDVHEVDYLFEEVVDFLEPAGSSQPKFIWWAPFTNHNEGLVGFPRPTARHEGTLDDLPPYEPTNLNVLPTNPPEWLTKLARTNASSEKRRQAALESTLVVEETIRALRILYPDLVIILTSDNGSAWGEHGMHAQLKSCPYLQCTAVPLVFWGPHLRPGVRTIPVIHEDITRTLLSLGRASTRGWEGISLMRWLRGRKRPINRVIQFHHGGSLVSTAIPVWDAWLSTRTQKIDVRYASGECERYDRIADPYELNNLASEDCSHERRVRRRRRR